MNPQNKRDLKQCILHLWSKFGILAWMDDELLHEQARDYRTQGRTHRQTDTDNKNTWRPKLASGKNSRLAKMKEEFNILV